MFFSNRWFYYWRSFMSKQRVKKSFIVHVGLLCLTAAVLLLSTSSAEAVYYTWNLGSGVSGDWTSADSWTPAGGPPTTSDYAYINNGGTASITSASSCNYLYVGQTYTGATDPTGHIVMTSGSLTLPYAGAIYVGNTATGTIEQSGGIVTNGGLGLKLGGGTTSAYTASGTYTLSGDALLLAGAETIGQRGSGYFIQNGGTNKTLIYNPYSGTTTLNNIIIGQYPSDGLGNGGTGTYTLTAGSVYASGISVGVNAGSIGEFKQSGGSVTLTSTTATPTGLSFATVAGSKGTYNLTGGTLTLQVLKKGTGTAAFNFGGGTLQAGAAFSSTLDMNLSGIGSDPLLTYNATVDTAGVPVTLSGTLSGVGGLDKQGDGILTLTAASSYVGPTKVYKGTLLVNGSLSSVVTANSGSTIGGSGSVGGLNVLSGATLSVGTSPGTMTVNGSVTLSGNDLVEIASSTSYDQLIVHGGTTTLGGTLTVDLGTFTPGSTDMYWIILDDANTTLAGTFDGLANGALVGSTGLYIYYNADNASGSLSGGNDVLLTPVPEPATFLLLTTAFLALLGYAGRRYRRKSL
jgi:autotransporter-associated beta strand protein